MQRTLTGDERRVTGGDDERGGVTGCDDAWVVAGWDATARVRAAQHPDQAVLNQFNTSPGVVDKSVSPGGWVVDPSPGVGVGVTS